MAVRGLDGHPLLPHKFPGSGGTNPPKKHPPKDPARDSPSDPGHGTPPNSGGGGGAGGTGGPVHDSPSDPGHGTSPVTGHPYKPPAWVIRRQQVLRRAGYHIAVDGVWGHASERAWAAFVSGIRYQTAANLHDVTVPPGMVRVGGVLVSKQQASTIRAIHEAEQSASAILHQQKLGQVVHQAQVDAKRAHSFASAAVHSIGQGHGVPAGTPPAIAERAKQKVENRLVRQQQSHLIDDTVQRIAGVSDTFIKGNPDWLEERAKQGAVHFHDVVILGQHGWLDLTDASDVRAVQHVINQDTKHHVHVTGQWDSQTNSALEAAWADAMAHDWHQAVESTRRTFYTTGIAAPVLQHVLGRQLDPAQLTRLLQTGGPRADRVVAALGRAFVEHAEDQRLTRMQKARAFQLGATGTGLDFIDETQRSFALRYLGTPQDAVLGRSTSLAELKHGLQWLAKQQQERAKRANETHGFWATVTGTAGAVVGGALNGVGQAIDVIEVPARNVEEWVFAIREEERALFGGTGLLDIAHQHNAGHLISWHDAVLRGHATYSDLPGWQGFIADVVTDPLTYVGPGLIRAGARGVGTVAFRSIDLVDHIEPVIGSRAADTYFDAAFRIIDLGEARPIIAAKGWIGGEFASRLPHLHSIYSRAFATRAAAMATVRKAVREQFITTLRDNIYQGFRIARDDVGTGASRRAAQMDSLFDPELLDNARLAAGAHREAIRAVAPDFVQALVEKVPTSLYADAERSGGLLSFTGRRLEARFLDAGSRSILARFAILDDLAEKGYAELIPNLRQLPISLLKAYHEAQFSRRELDQLLRKTGAWGKSVPYDWRADYYAELRQLTDQIHQQILPALDDLLLEFHGPGLFDAAGHLLDEAGPAIQQALRDFFGHDIKEAYEDVVWIENPNHLAKDGTVRVWSQRERDELIQDEIGAATASARSYQEMQERLTGESWEAWAEQKITKAAIAARSAWKETPKGWIDKRKTIPVPRATARGHEIYGRTIAHTQAAQLAEATIDAPHLNAVGDTFGVRLVDGHVQIDAFSPLAATPKVKNALMQGASDDLARRVLDESWMRYADKTARLEAAQALAASGFAAKMYRKNFLLMQALRHSQARTARQAHKLLERELYGWKSAVLIGRPAFTVRNDIDNFAKAYLEGARDPRLWFNPDGRSLFQVFPIRAMRGAISYFDRLSGRNALGAFDGFLDHFWTQHTDTIEKLIGVHGLKLADGIVDDTKTIKALLSDPARKLPTAKDPRSIRAGDILERVVPQTEPTAVGRALEATARRTGFKSAAEMADKTTEFLWEWMAARPENYAKRVLFYSEKRRALKAGLTEKDADLRAIKKVADALFDYSTITVTEENLKVFIPFIFFLRKNASFWARTAYRHPWFYPNLDRVYEGHQNSNSDEPSWMRRYFSLGFAADLAEDAHLGFLAPWLRDANVDPLNNISVASFYRAFKSENPLLPDDHKGSWIFLSRLVDGLNSYLGVGFNPLFTEPAARFGYLNRRSWQDIFPQTTFIEAITNTHFVRQYLGPDGKWAHVWGETGFNIEDVLLDPVFKQIAPGQPSGQELTRERFDYLVGQELAFQRLRGETPNIENAQAKVRGMVLFSNLVGFTIGLFPRMISPEAQALSQIKEMLGSAGGQGDASFQAAWYGLSDRERQADILFNDATKRHYSPRQIAHHAELLAGAQVYAQIDDPQQRSEWLKDNPDVATFLDPVLSGRQPNDQFIRDLLLNTDTDAVMRFTQHYLKGIGAANDVQNEAFNTLATPTLRRFWARNDTTAELRQRHAAGAYFQYLDRVNRSYHAIPEADFEARQGFLDSHPELQDWWTANDGATDDYRSVMMSANSTFRTVYFDLVERSGFDAADEFLRRHPFIFDFTSAEGRVTPEGRWTPKSEWQHDYAKIVEDERVYYQLRQSDRAGYLETHPNLQRYFAKYGAKGQVRPFAQAGGLSQHAKDYLAVKPLLDAYFQLSPGDRERFLDAHPELRDYFAKYSSERTQSQHARDYLAIKPVLDAFFRLPESKRSAYLAKHPDLQAYFDKYSSGKNGTSGHDYHSAVRESLAENPDIASRYHFWMRFFALPPHKRAEFIHRHASDAGIFIYGSLSYDARQAEEARWHRNAVRLGQTDRAYLYVKVAPLLDIYFSLPKGSADRALFLQVNPEVKLYLDRYTGSPIKNPHIRSLVEHYFQLEPFSDDRKRYIEEHPELHAYFNRNPSKREAVIQRQLDAFFQFPFGPKRDEYLARHPELKHYFDQRAEEQANYESLAAAFNDADPRMRKFYEMYADIIPLDQMRLEWLRAQGKHPIQNLVASGRAPLATADELRRLDRAGTDPNLD